MSGAEAATPRGYRVRISPDGRVAYVTPEAVGEPLPVDALEQLVRGAGVSHGLDAGLLAQAAAGDAGKNYPVARASEPQPGDDGRVVMLVEAPVATGPTVLDDGRVDYLTRDSIANVTAGQPVASIVPPTAGTPGTGVDGRPLDPRPGRPVRSPVGRNVELSEDGLQVLASMAGELGVAGSGRISVVDVHRVPGDVDVSTGNIDFVGSVAIRGRIRTGLTVRAAADIIVGDAVEGAVLEAGGDIIVSGGIRPSGRGSVTAAGSVKAGFIEHGTVVAGSDVLVGEAILHSQVEAGGEVRVAGRRGLIAGGRIRAGRGITARVAGAQLATKTLLELGVSDRTRQELREAAELLKQLKEGLKTVSAALEHPGLADNPEMLARLRATRQDSHNRVQETEAQMARLDERFQVARKGRVVISDIVHAGVRVNIGNSHYRVTERISPARFGLDETGEVTLLAFGRGDRDEGGGLAGFHPEGSAGGQDP